MSAIKYRSADVDGLKIFYREAGCVDAPALLLLHGFPSASHMFRDLIPPLADRLHIIAPDLPGFGQSEMPARSEFSYTFDHIAGVIDRFTEVVGLKRFAIYVFDYGASELAARTRETALVEHGDEDLHGVDAVHRLLRILQHRVPDDRYSPGSCKNPDLPTFAARGDPSPRLPERSAPPRSRRCNSARWRGRTTRTNIADRTNLLLASKAASGGFRSFADTRANGKVAPKAAIPRIASSRLGSTHSSSLL
jgi:pimeloyl-ACP methyl ester carboxylesterase